MIIQIRLLHIRPPPHSNNILNSLFFKSETKSVVGPSISYRCLSSCGSDFLLRPCTTFSSLNNIGIVRPKCSSPIVDPKFLFVAPDTLFVFLGIESIVVSNILFTGNSISVIHKKCSFWRIILRAFGSCY